MKKILLAPGPTPVPERVFSAMSHPMVYHRGPEFAPVMRETRELLARLHRTAAGQVVILSSSGTGALEASVTNVVSPGETAIVVRGGKFGERFSEIATAFGARVENIDVEWGDSVDPGRVEDALKKMPDARAVLVQASETSTGVRHPIREIAALTRGREGCALVVDAVTALGVFDVPMDSWGIDVVAGGSQKGLMCPPGLGTIALSPKALAMVERSKSPRYYFDLRKELKNQAKDQHAFTSPVSLVFGLREALRMIEEEGLDNVFARHDRLARAARAAGPAMGIRLFPRGTLTEACTAYAAPDGVDGQAVVKRLREAYGVTIAGGQDRLKGKIFRLAHLGHVGPFDVLTGISALEMALADLGAKVTPGTGVAAAEAVLRAQA